MCPQMSEVAHSPKIAQAGAALGTNAKLRAFPEMQRRLERFALQSVARSILPESRTAKCLRIRAREANVQVWNSTKHRTAHYGGLQTCGSVWACPVCAAKIAERRRNEIRQAIDMHRAEGGEVQLLTLTTPHTRFDRLSDLLAMQQKAVEAFLRDGTVRKQIFVEMGYVGQIRAWEGTHGRKGTGNGWHPHFHFLQFVGSKVDAAKLTEWKERLYARWRACCEKVGLGAPSLKHGIDLQDGSEADRYLSKWGLEDEMTKAHLKKAKEGGETPFDLLRAYLADPNDKQAAALFREFVENFKGKRQLSWSNGLKARFYVDDKTDEELAEEQEEQAVLLGQITVDQWRDVLKVKGRGVVLEIAAATRSWERVEQYLYFIKGAHDPTQLVCEITSEMLQEVRQLLLEGHS